MVATLVMGVGVVVVLSAGVCVFGDSTSGKEARSAVLARTTMVLLDTAAMSVATSLLVASASEELAPLLQLAPRRW